MRVVTVFAALIAVLVVASVASVSFVSGQTDAGTPIPLQNPAIPPDPVGGQGPLLIPLEMGDSSSATEGARPVVASSLRSTSPDQPSVRFLTEKSIMLGLINAERKKAGVPEVSLGDNIAAQIHAENSIRDCVSGHWGTDGLGPPMRYSLAGGYQSNGENASGYSYCLTDEEWPSYASIHAQGGIQNKLRQIMRGYMNSPGHKSNILYAWHRKVNLGVAWDTHQMWNVQHFEGDYADCSVPPMIEGTTLRVSCTAKEVFPSGVFAQQIYYDPPYHALRRGQIARSYGYVSGNVVGLLREEAGQGYYWPTDEEQVTHYSGCTPYDVDPSLPPPSSFDEMWSLHNKAKLCEPTETTVTVPWITGDLTIDGRSFVLAHDIGPVLGKHGTGVYTLVVWGCSVPDSPDNPCVDDNSMPILEKSIFYGIDPPDTYTPKSESTPTPTPTPSATTQRADCGSAVADTSNAGLVSDCEILLGLKDTLQGSASLNWSSSLPITRWTGVILGGTPQRVTIVKLQKRSLTGSIPAGLGSLAKLQDLWLYTNELTGPLPAELGNLSDLETLMLSHNDLSGQIPLTLNDLSLERLWLKGNNFTGCMPANLLEVPDGDAATLRLPTCESGTTTPTPTPSPTATPTPPPPGTTPTPTPTDDPGALDSTLMWHIHCQADDFLAAFGEEYVMDDELTLHYIYERNGRGLWHVLRTIWRSSSNTDIHVACMTKVYDNVSSAIWDHQFTAMLEEALGDSDVLRQNKRCCIEIGNGFKGLMLDIGSTFSDSDWQDTLEARSGVASFRREQVIVRVASYDRRGDGGYHLLEVDEMARRVNSRFYDGIFDDIETRSLSNGSGTQMSTGRPFYLNPFSPSGE